LDRAGAIRRTSELCKAPGFFSGNEASTLVRCAARPETRESWGGIRRAELPVEHWLAGRLARRLHALRTEAPELQLGPDGKVLVVVADEGDSWVLEGFSCSLQQRAKADDVALHRAVRLAIGAELERLSDVRQLVEKARWRKCMFTMPDHQSCAPARMSVSRIALIISTSRTYGARFRKPVVSKYKPDIQGSVC